MWVKEKMPVSLFLTMFSKGFFCGVVKKLGLCGKELRSEQIDRFNHRQYG